MNNLTKKDFLLIGCSFAAGMFIMGAASLFYRCQAPQNFRPVPPVALEQQPMPESRIEHHDNRYTEDDRSFERRHENRHRRPRHPDMFHSKHTPEHLDKILNLSAEQKAQIEEFRKQDMAEFEIISNKMKELRNQAGKIRQRGKARFESILTDEQKTVLQQIHERFAPKPNPDDKNIRPHHFGKKAARMMPNGKKDIRPAQIPQTEEPEK